MQSSKARGNSGTGRRTNVKSGCRTCKIRKVKCDEGRPACRRCLSTGRVCDGYGVWGGGGNSYGQRQTPTAPAEARNGVTVRSPKHLPLLVVSVEEKECFDWFTRLTTVKLPGSFTSGFWTTLLLQASLSEQAILHAILALSSVHRGGVLTNGNQRHGADTRRRRELFTLQHYGEAIKHLQPHFSASGTAAVRVALVACVVFVSVDLLRGHFRTAQTHLQSGLALLEELHKPGMSADDPVVLNLRHESTDDWITEALIRLHVQAVLWQPIRKCPSFVLQYDEPRLQVSMFSSLKEAWDEMDRLLIEVFRLTEQAREQKVHGGSLPHIPDMFEQQRQVQVGLVRWLDVYTRSRETLRNRKSIEEEKAYRLLCIYHSMVTIMADVCLYPDDEMVFDLHTSAFVHLITQLVDLWALSAPGHVPRARSGRVVDMSRSIVDMGWIPPLYYVAIRCRVHRIRLLAIRLLGCTSHQEGFWDATIAARVARKVMEVEEGDFYKDTDPADDFQPSSYPSTQDLSLPLIPDHQRLRDVEVVLLGNPLEKVLLSCVQRRDGVDCKIPIGEYHLASDRWVDTDKMG
ncbi:C6 zinc finger domain protein [Pleurostoma richardsiae]|uniref:C6 zinc finger domain protein n=1 Tax=Pleurostoma richardsiae TaxID=41990 RepID=A0AA38RJC8_9PEZI|nr:C6 zinc finger domain protein [Pleurostoma richardsiae]